MGLVWPHACGVTTSSACPRSSVTASLEPPTPGQAVERRGPEEGRAHHTYSAARQRPMGGQWRSTHRSRSRRAAWCVIRVVTSSAVGVIEGEVGVDEDGDGAHPPTPWSRAALLQASALLTRCRPAAQSTRARVGVGHVVRELAQCLGHARGRCAGRPGPRRRRRGRASSSSWTVSHLGEVVGREGQGATPAGPLEEGPYLTCWRQLWCADCYSD